jgi:amino acid transporter
MSGFSGFTVFSRIAYSMARDGAFPYSDYLKVVDPVTKVPNRIIGVLFFAIFSLCLLPLLSESTFTAII